MTMAQTCMRCLLVVAALYGITACAADADWATANAAGEKAFMAGQVAEAEKQFAAALKIAEDSGVQDARLTRTLNSLAELYRAQA